MRSGLRACGYDISKGSSGPVICFGFTWWASVARNHVYVCEEARRYHTGATQHQVDLDLVELRGKEAQSPK